MKVNSVGQVSMNLGGAPHISLFLKDANNQAYQINVTTLGTLTATQTSSSSGIASVRIGNSNYGLAISTTGNLEVVYPFIGPSMWVPNGFGAGTDNSVVGGAGGFMAIPQPPNPIGVGPEANGQYEALVFNYNSGTSQGAGNVFSINNPGRN